MKRFRAFTMRRSTSAAVLLVGGGAISIAVWVSGAHGFAVAVATAYVVLSLLVYLWAGGRGDVAAVLRLGSDERQRGLDRDATAISGVAMAMAAIIGAIVDIARVGNPGSYGVICVAGGLSYGVGFLLLRRRQ